MSSQLKQEPLYPERVTSELMSQTMSHRIIGEVLWRFDRQVWGTYSVHKISVEPWATGVRVFGPGVRGGIIAYKDLAYMLQDEAKAKAQQLPVQKKGESFWIVRSSQGSSWYSVLGMGTNLSCNCVKFRCWNNRMYNECPALFNALNRKIFCHHTIAVKLHEGMDELRLFQ